MCIQLPTKVKNDKPRVFKSEKSAIQGLLNGWKNKIGKKVFLCVKIQ